MAGRESEYKEINSLSQNNTQQERDIYRDRKRKREKERQKETEIKRERESRSESKSREIELNRFFVYPMREVGIASRKAKINPGIAK